MRENTSVDKAQNQTRQKKHVVFSGVAGSGLHCVFLAGPRSSDNRLSAGDICESDPPTLRSALK